MRLSRISFLLCAVFSALAFAACARSLGYGVVLWSPDEVTAPTGSVLKIRSKMQRRLIYRAELEGRSVYEIDQWRVRLFRSRGAAQNYAKEYAQYVRSYAENQRQGLPMRAEAKASSERVYKLREGQTLKVIGRGKDRVRIGSNMGYWYQLLTEDGVTGYVYGRYLREYWLADSGKPIYDEKDYLGDAILENFFDPALTWRPKYYNDMINAQEIDLERFLPDYGLFIDPNRKTIRVAVPERTATFAYSRIMPLGNNIYVFDGSGASNFSFTLSERSANVRYQYNGQNFKEDFVAVRQDVAEYIQEEGQRRAQKYRDFLNLGPVFTGEFGQLAFTGNGAFRLTGAGPLKNYMYLNDSDGETGEVRFDLFVGDTMRQKYDGAFTLVFEESGTKLPFLYSFSSQGFEARLVESVPPSKTIKDEISIGSGLTGTFRN